MNRLEGKVAIITGAARGQGAAEARLFVEEGASVVVADVLGEQTDRLVAELGPSARAVHLDVTDEKQWERAVSTAASEFGSVDVLVNNAGIARYSPIADLALAEYMAIINVNQVGTFLGMRAVIPSMRSAGRGSIVNISSTSGLVGAPGTAAYTASKFAVRGMTKTAALELASSGIRVNSVHPGGVDTPMLRSDDMDDAAIGLDAFVASVPLRRLAQPIELARLVLFLASDESSFCTGSEFVADGGLTAGPIS
ncbi:MAG: glucose 1-dehydrogenase [Actinobacteria bacterium]|nr:glucose 1-dehydrogenase [Actinomycetota bacterium]